MASEGLSRRQEMPADVSAEDDYRSFCDALSSTARGRAFLEEFSRRNRQADTETVLTALNRLEATALSHAATSPEADRIRQDLRALLDTLRTARPQTENSPTAIKAATLAALIDFAQARIESLVMPAAASESETLAAVPVPEQPELPIPHPTATAAPVMALVPAPAASAAPLGTSPVHSHIHSQVHAPAKRKIAAVIPTVEFDYRMHQAVRPAPVRTAPEEAWSALAPPVISAPAYAAPLPSSPVIAEPAPSPATDIVPQTGNEAGADATVDTGKTVEPYELWLDPPTVAAAEAETPATTALETLSLTVDLAVAEWVTPPPAEWAVTQNEAAADTTPATTADTVIAETAAAETVTVETAIIEAAIAETTYAETAFVETTFVEATFAETAVADGAMTEASLAAPAVEDDATSTAGTTMDTIESLMQQMEKTAAPAPAVRGHADGVDPLAPIMALSEEERIALFT